MSGDSPFYVINVCKYVDIEKKLTTSGTSTKMFYI